MKIKARLYATLAKYRPGESGRHEWIGVCPTDATVEEFLLQTGVPLDQAHLIFINGVSRSLDAVLQDGDQLGIFPAIGGG